MLQSGKNIEKLLLYVNEIETIKCEACRFQLDIICLLYNFLCCRKVLDKVVRLPYKKQTLYMQFKQ